MERRFLDHFLVMVQYEDLGLFVHSGLSPVTQTVVYVSHDSTMYFEQDLFQNWNGKRIPQGFTTYYIIIPRGGIGKKGTLFRT